MIVAKATKPPSWLRPSFEAIVHSGEADSWQRFLVPFVIAGEARFVAHPAFVTATIVNTTIRIARTSSTIFHTLSGYFPAIFPV